MSKEKRAEKPDPWVARIEKDIKAFSEQHRAGYSYNERQLCAAFEIGCYLALIKDYERQDFDISLKNLTNDEEFRYLTTPNGNPSSFSFVEIAGPRGRWEVRQQVRIASHIHSDVNFTPDIVVLDSGARIDIRRDSDYAGGKRGFFRVASEDVVAAHECKSMSGFPELYVSFLGLFFTAHDWIESEKRGKAVQCSVGHLAPTLFVGGEPSNLHRRMLKALEATYAINIITGLHQGGWTACRREDELNRLPIAGADVPANLLDRHPLEDEEHPDTIQIRY